MFCDAINKYQVNVFSRCSNLYFDMRKVSFVVFAFVEYVCFDLAFLSVTQFGSHCPFIVVQKLAVGFETYHIVLSEFIHFQKHFVIIVTTIHCKSCFFKECSALLHCLESDGVCRFIISFRGRMYS